MSKLFIERDTLTAIADAIREKGGFEASMTPAEMVNEIRNLPDEPFLGGIIVTENGIYTAEDEGIDGFFEVEVNVPTSGGLPEEAFVITGDCSYRFAANGWNWFIDTYGSQITTENISNISNMFLNSTNLTSIPFEINTYLKSTIDTHNMTSVFSDCQNLLALPSVNNARPSQIESLFKNCYRLREVPASFYESWTWDSAKNASQLFNGCYSLRKAPIDMLAQLENYPYSSDYYYSYIYQGFYYCVVLDELINLPIPSCYISPNITGNMFYNFVTRCQRLKNLTFALQEDGTPYVVKWKSQTIDLTNYVGYAFDTTAILNYNSGITSDKLVKNADTYAALKDDEDWYSNLASYSRYNHDSAVATINSLPDTSAYLASAGGTNTIKFKGTCGSATDGGAINTLTEEEIAVATAKGWTVSLV